MNGLIDTRKIPNVGDSFLESYIRYGKNDLHEMDEKDLKEELNRTIKEIKTIQDEIEDANSFPSYALKEKLENAYFYKEKIEKALSSYKKESTCYIDTMLEKLTDEYNNGNITKEYYDYYTEKLNYKRVLYSDRLKDEKEQANLQLKQERAKEEALNKRPFRKFKNKLMEYRKK